MKPRLIALIAAIHIPAIHAETTENLLGTQWDTTGAVRQTDSSVRFSYTQGVARQDIDLSDYDNIESLTYGGSFIGCNNFIGGHCGSTNPYYYDQVVVKLYVGDQVYEQTVTTDYNQGVTAHEWTVDLAESPTSATLQFSGYDPGYWAGWYGAIVLEPYLKANYSWAILEPVINPEPIQPSTVAQVTSGALTEVITPTVSVDSIIDQISPDIASPTVEVQPTVEPVAQETAVSEPVEVSDVPTQAAQPEQVEQQEQVAEAVAEVKAEGGKVSAKAIAAQLGSAYDPAAQGVMMALMNRPQIKQPSLTDTQFYVDRGLRDKSIKDRFWLDSLVSDVKWNSMVDSEWQR